MEKIACNLCGSKNTEHLLKTQDILYKTTDQLFNIVRCINCGLVYLNPRPSEINHFYPDHYKPYKEEGYTDFIYKIPINPEKNVLDFGCGSGDDLVKLAKQHPNWALYGLDCDKRAVDATKKYGFPCFYGSPQEAKYLSNSFDEIYMMNVLEHLHEPLETLRETARILKKDGSLFILTQNFRSLSRMIFQNKWYGLETPRHLYHFTPCTLKNMLFEAGFNDITVSYIPSPKYLLQSWAFWKCGGKTSYPKYIWRLLTIPAILINFFKLSDMMKVVAKK
ncbi:class I SAM-dependent methyltransferase [Patescibacteria group bacterium]